MPRPKILEKQLSYFGGAEIFLPTKILCSDGTVKQYKLNSYWISEQEQEEKLPVQTCIANKMLEDGVDYEAAKTECEDTYKTTVETEQSNGSLHATLLQQCLTYMQTRGGIRLEDAETHCKAVLTNLSGQEPMVREIFWNPPIIEMKQQSAKDRFIADFVSAYNLHPSVPLAIYRKQVEHPNWVASHNKEIREMKDKYYRKDDHGCMVDYEYWDEKDQTCYALPNKLFIAPLSELRLGYTVKGLPNISNKTGTSKRTVKQEKPRVKEKGIRPFSTREKKTIAGTK